MTSPSTEFRFGSFVLQPARRMLLCGADPVRLGSRAMDLLIVLVERAGDVVSKEDLMARVWPNAVVDEGGLRVHMAALRKALGEGQSGIRYITNVPLRGYALVAPVARFVHAETDTGSVDTAANSQMPTPLSRLIGRDEAMAALIETLPQRRFVTLVGPGGIGKTSVALGVAEGLRGKYKHGMHFVDLTSLTDGKLVASAVAAVLGVPLHSEDATRDIIATLAEKNALMLLDNCEHVIAEAASFVERLVSGASGIHVVATSREPLRARGEWVQRLSSLGVPPDTAEMGYKAALNFPAFELFVQRAMASLDGISYGDNDVPKIAQLCRRLDGIPLAIELVAAQVGFFGLAGLVRKLEDQLSLPTLGLRTALPRHQTLRATLDWSFDLLSPNEQRVLRRLSIFRDRFSLADALAVTGDESGETPHALMNLVSKSLVTAEPADDGVQYKLLETTRSFSSEKLSSSDERQMTAARHAAFCRDAVRQATVEFDTLIPARWRDRHGRKVDDLRSALNWAFGKDGDAEVGATLVAESPALWFGLWLVKEYLAWLERAIEGLPAAAVGAKLDMQIAVEYGQASIAMRGARDESLAALEKAAEIARQLGDADYEMRALWACFGARLLRGDYLGALKSTELFGTVANSAHAANASPIYHRMKALCLHFLGDQATALTHARKALDPMSLRLRFLHGNTYQFEHQTASLVQLARVLWLQGQSDQAAQVARHAVETARAADHALSLTYALAYAACPISLWRGDNDAAREYVDALQTCADEHSLVFWQSWPLLYRHVLTLRECSSAAVAPLDLGTLQLGQLDILATLHPDYVGEVVVERAKADSNLWCKSEILRVRAIHAMRSSSPSLEEAEALARESLSLARQQGAFAWALRSATTLAELLLQTGRRDEALQAIREALIDVPEGAGTTDVTAAHSLVQRLDDPGNSQAGRDPPKLTDHPVLQKL